MSTAAHPRLPLVACLCAAWCGTCRDYAEPFARLAERHAGAADFAWVDVEDDADALGDLDIENFPSLLIEVGGAVAFFGPVTPHLQTAERLLQTALAGAQPPIDDAAVVALAAQVRGIAASRAAGPARSGVPMAAGRQQME